MREAKDVLPQVIADLHSSGVGFALIGALAVGVRAEERFTKDLDFAISVRDQDDAMRVLRHLVDTLRYREPRPFNDNTVDFKGVSLLPPDIESPFPVDILWNACGVEREIVARAERVQFLPGVFVGVATRADLIAMKILALDDARRPRDRGDLAALLRSATAVEVAESRALLRLMEVRGVGFPLGKDDLSAELDQALELYAPELSQDLGHDMDR